MKRFQRLLAFFFAMLFVFTIPVSADGVKTYKATDNFEELVADDKNPEARPYGAWRAGSNKVHSLVDILPKEMILQTAGFTGGDYEYYQDSTSNNEFGAAINGPYKNSGKGFKVGDNVEFGKGFGTHPKSKQEAVYINIDISAYTDKNGEYGCDTFYTCVGLTNTGSEGVYFQVFADYGNGKFKQVGNSTVITGKKLGEFNIDITGVKVLKLVVITATANNGSSASAWLAPSIFKADPNAIHPKDIPVLKPDEIQIYEPTDNYEELFGNKENPSCRPYSVWKAGSNVVYSLVDLIPAEKIAMTELASGSNYEYYKDSTSLNEYGVSINGPYKKSGKAFLVGTNVNFNKGFGTHPRPEQEVTYINLDVSAYTDPNGKYQCDTFYSCVGLTNTASAGVYFQVFADYGDGNYQHIANSNVIKLHNLGEFNVDITGVKILRLVVITAKEDNASSGSAWLNPCIFKADPAAKKPSYVLYDPYEEYATEDPANIPTVELRDWSAEAKKNDSSALGIIIGAAAAVLLVAAAVVTVLLLKRKKAGKE